MISLARMIPTKLWVSWVSVLAPTIYWGSERDGSLGTACTCNYTKVGVYVYIYITYIYIYIIYIYIYIYINMYIYICTHIYIYICIRVDIWHDYILVYICMWLLFRWLSHNEEVKQILIITTHSNTYVSQIMSVSGYIFCRVSTITII